MTSKQATTPLLTRLARCVGLAALEGASTAFAVWHVRAFEFMPSYGRKNDLEEGFRFDQLSNVAAGGALAIGAALAVLAARRRKGDGLERVEEATRRMAPLLGCGLAATLLDWRVWGDRVAVFAVLAIALGLTIEATLRWAAGAPALVPLRFPAAVVAALERLRDRIPAAIDPGLAATVLGAAGYAAYFAATTIEGHRDLRTSALDLGLEDNLMWNLVHGGPLFKSSPFSGPTGTHFGHHATFFAFLLAPVYRLAPGAETLLVVQAVLMGAAAVPLYLYARRHLPGWVALAVAWAYLAYPPLHGAALYDFHYLPLGPIFLWLTLYAIESRRRVLAAVAAAVALSVREDVAASLAVIGAFSLLTGTAAVEGALLAVAGTVYFVVLKLVVMPHYKEGGIESFVNQYSGLLSRDGKGFGGVLETAIGNLAFTADVVIDRDKITYLAQIVAPLAALPLREPIALLLVLPGLLFTLLSTGYWPLTQISFQYTTYWTTFLFIALVVTLERAAQPRRPGDTQGPARQRAAVAALVACSLVCTLYQGAFARHPAVRGGFGPYVFGTRKEDRVRRAHLTELVERLPPDARVSASEQLVPHVSQREQAYTLRYGVYDAEYLLFQIPISGEEADHALPLLESGEFGVVADTEDMVLARRGHATDLNVALLARAR